MRADEFLKQYRVLEDLLEKRYIGQDMTGRSAIVQYIGDPDSKGMRPELDMMRVIRNLLTHNANSDGSSVVEPSQEVLDTLERIIKHVRKPRTANDYGTPKQSILFAHPDDLLVDVIRNMKERGFAYLPICERGVVKRVFTKDSIFYFAVVDGLDRLHADMRIKDLDAYTEIDQLPENSYCFIPKNLSITGVLDAFNRWTNNASHLQIAFVTKTGSPDEPLLRLITPWDVLSAREDLAHGKTVQTDV